MTAETTPTRKPSLRWRKCKAPTGLARVCWTGHEDRELTLGGEEIATVRPVTDGRRGAITGWWWAGRVGASHENTYRTPLATREEAQAACIAWAREKLGAA
jgi:hypothetical protein